MRLSDMLSLPQKVILALILLSTLSLAQGRESIIAADFYRDEVTLVPGDRLKISYVDIGPQGNPIEKISIVEVRHDGTIFHELLKVIYVQNLTIKQIEELINVKLSEFFTQPQAVVSIISKSTNKVFLWGGVNQVGVYEVTPGTRIAEFIIQRGGVTADADISKITLTRKDGTVVIFNLERYLFTNEEVNNVELRNEDKIIVPRIVMKDEYARLSK
ncbi:MAG: polysaccharide biosynthesis/export family protein, partial [Candidatus Neomarinimicrobiota bacterium]